MNKKRFKLHTQRSCSKYSNQGSSLAYSQMTRVISYRWKMRQGFVLLFKGFCLLKVFLSAADLFWANMSTQIYYFLPYKIYTQKAYNPEILRSISKKKFKKLKSLFSDVCLSVKSFTTYSKVRHFLPIS